MFLRSKKKKPPEQSVMIRDYSPEDYPRIIELWKLTGMGDEQRGDDQQVIERSLELGGRLLVMIRQSGNEIIGTSWITFDGRRLHLHHFGIHPDYQGQGLSHRLAEASIAFAREKKTQIKLEVHRNNRKAVSLYKKHGFKYLGDYNVYIIRDP